MAYKTILFDVDNTLIDSATIAATVFHEVAANYGLAVPAKTIRGLVGIPTEKIIQQLKLTHATEINRDFTSEIGTHKDELRLFDGIHETWDKLLAIGLQIGVVTSRTTAEVKSDLGNFPEITNLPIIVTADKTTEHKPSGAPLEYAIQQYNLIKAETMYVGDTIYDLQSALNAGIDFASATWGALASTDFSKATYQPEEPTDLLKIVKI
ncbi:HAD family hydrolase [Lactiplantibacillus sp. WILCCON 0030]|uniref:HAD family hydrolase n=1 Tax=Lactiplantibacillus brownii TaxID=3069269 RepID=A0ABU1ACG9_9LACO|nr:HAD family hydrolase [Lactiplantibacillus brownii]MDQ7938649.1 HAD family hydrolase [Lactiplantibacillus brownii]